MKIPRELNTYCRRCNAKTKHKVELYKPGKPRKKSWGLRQLEKKRKGYGGEPRGRLRRKAKTTKKTVIILKCEKCGYKTMRNLGRLSRVKLEG